MIDIKGLNLKRYVKRNKIENPHYVIWIDGMNLFLRNFFATFGKYTNSKNQDISGIYTSTTFMLKLIDHFRKYNALPNTSIHITFERGKSSKHKSLSKDYKANRKISADMTLEKKDAFHRQKSQFIDVCKILPLVNTFELYMVEGDFVIAYAMDRYEMHLKNTLNIDKNKIVNVVISTDKDFLQLIDRDNVVVFNPLNHTLITQDNLKDEFSEIDSATEGRDILLHKIIRGDKSDNIVGVKGFGNKTLDPIFNDYKKTFNENMTDEELEDMILSESVLEKLTKHKQTLLKEYIENIKTNFKLINLISYDNVMEMMDIQTIKEVTDNLKDYLSLRVGDIKPEKGFLSLYNYLYHKIEKELDLDKMTSIAKNHIIHHRN